MRSFRGYEDSVILGDIDSHPYEEDAREVLLLIVEFSPLDTRSCEEIRLGRGGSKGVLRTILVGVRAP